MKAVQQYPLRKIIGTKEMKIESIPMMVELLSCGHKGEICSQVNSGMFSPKSARSRRCSECFKEIEEFVEAEYESNKAEAISDFEEGLAP